MTNSGSSGQTPYTRSDSTVAAILSANSTSPHYQLYTAEFVASNNIQDTHFFDLAAQIGGEDVRDAGWTTFDLGGSPFGCST